MKRLRLVAETHRRKIAAAIVLIGVAITPIMMWLAYLERGYKAIGGEFGPLVLSLVIAVLVLDILKDKQQADKSESREEDEQCSGL